MRRLSKQLALSGQLSPVARLGEAVSDFSNALNGKHKEEFSALRRSKNAPLSASDVIKVTEEVNREGRQRHRTWRPNGPKVGAFLAKLQVFANVGDVIVGGAQDLMISGVWGAVRLCLLAALDYLSYFERVAALFLKLGNSWTLHRDFAHLFPHSRELQVYLCEYLIVVVRICIKVVEFTKKPFFLKIATSLTSSFDAEFNPLATELDQWGYYIEHKAQQVAMESGIRAGASAIERMQGLYRLVDAGFREQMENKKQRLLLQNLFPEQAENELRQRRHRKKGTCTWILENSSYASWRRRRESSVLWIDGKLGSGKTVAMANIVADIILETPCAYFFCTFKELSTLSPRSVIGSLAFQFLQNLPTEDVAWKKLQGDQELYSTYNSLTVEKIISILLQLIPRNRKYYIVLDGIEDCEEGDEILASLQTLARSVVVLLCCSSRTDSVIHRFAQDHIPLGYTVSLNDLARNPEVEEFIDREVERRRNLSPRQMGPKLEFLVREHLKQGAQGMYLWVSLQLEAIFPTHRAHVMTDEDVLNILTNLPKDLPEAFENALSRIIDKRYGEPMMKFVAAATHPLKIDELRVALTIVPGEPVWHPLKLPQDGEELVSLSGGNLIELDEEDQQVRFIHHSVLLHLFSLPSSSATLRYHFSPEESDHYMGIACVTYLHFPVFDTRMNIQRKVKIDDIADKISEATTSENTLLARTTRHLLNRKKTNRNSQFDIGRIVSEIQSYRIQSQALEKSLFAYASRNWLIHTKTLPKARDVNTWHLWIQLVQGDVPGVEPIFTSPREDPMLALDWATRQSHGSLFLYILGAFRLSDEQLHGLSDPDDGLLCSTLLRGPWLGDIIAQYLQAGSREVATVQFLMGLRANPVTSHHRTNKAPLQILLNGPACPELPGILDLLLSSPAVIESLAEDWVGASLVSLVCRDDHNALCRVLSYRPNLQVLPPEDSLLGLAVARGNLALAGELLDAGANISNSFVYGKPAIQVALESKRRDLVELLAPGVNTLSSDKTPLLYLALCSMEDAWAELLLELGANPDGGFVLMAALDAEKEAFDRSLYRYPLEVALENGRTAASLVLINKVADVNLGTPLDTAVRMKNDIAIARLLEVGAESRLLSRSERDELSGLCFSSIGIAWKLFPDYRSNPTRQAQTDSTPYLSAYHTLDIDARIHIVELLLQGNPPPLINAQDEIGQTALHYAVPFGERAIRQLLSAGANPNILNHRGESPLFLAACLRSSSEMSLVVSQLLRAGADPNVTTLNGASPLELAMLNPRAQEVLLPLLLEFGVAPKKSFQR